MLHLIGLGLEDDEITVKGFEALKNAEKVFAEFYTNTETMDLDALEEKTGTTIEKLEREKVEQQDRVIESARKLDTAFLVSGDPLTATTHYDIKHRAEKEGVETRVIHAPSIFTSIAETGLNAYKFGRTVTLPRDSSPRSVVEHITLNDSVGLHTLVLLDIDYSADRAASKLIDMEPELAGRETVVLERANHSSQDISVLKLEELQGMELGGTPHCLILPGETSHMEDEFLEAYR